MGDLRSEIPRVVDLFYGERVRVLIAPGLLEIQGDPRRMRFSAVRLPGEQDLQPS